MLGIWQGIFVLEHRGAAQMRNVVLHLLGEVGSCVILAQFF